MTDAIVARIMRIRNGMIPDADAEAIVRREIAALRDQAATPTEQVAWWEEQYRLAQNEIERLQEHKRLQMEDIMRLGQEVGRLSGGAAQPSRIDLDEDGMAQHREKIRR